MNGKYNFNHGWRFHEGELEETTFGRKIGDPKLLPKWTKATDYGVALAGYPCDNWEKITLPHDFVIERCEFSEENCGSTGSLGGGKGWYRKEFDLPENTLGNRVFVEFDGIYRDSQVWCNGGYMGSTMSGFRSISYEITEALNYDSVNAIAVTCDATEYEGWWYTGGGIYRDSRIVIKPMACFDYNSIYVKTESVDLDTKKSCFTMFADINHVLYEEVDGEFTFTILDGDDNEVLSKTEKITVLNKNITNIEVPFVIENAKLWSDKNPHLYKAVVSITTKYGTQTEEIRFAPRTIEYNAETGMKLNGEEIFLNGVCGHDDFAGVGVALNRSVIEYKIDKLKGMGCNAYRCSHNPPTPLFLEVCDEKGFIVMDETRLPAIGDDIMDDFLEFIKRDRNHPSVFFWSLWNEESLIHGTDVGIRIYKKMKNLGLRLDDTRDYLMAINTTYSEVITYHEEHGLQLPLNGVNYMEMRSFDLYDRLRTQFPGMCFMNTEITGSCATRGYKLFDKAPSHVSDSGDKSAIWVNKRTKNIATCYADSYPPWGLTLEESLKAYDGRKHMLGMFLWTGFDYRGEIYPYLYPNVISLFGIIDLCGFYKDWAYYLKSALSDEPQLHFMPSTWNLKEEDSPINVCVFSNCNEAELFLNGKSLGRKTKERLDKFEWEVKYEKGELLAIGYKDGVACVEEKIQTSGKEHKIVLETNVSTLKANSDDCAFVTVHVVDENGLEVTDSTVQIDFEVTGSAKIIGTGNGDYVSHEHDKLPTRKLFAGKAMAIVQSGFNTEKVTFTATSNGLVSASIDIDILADNSGTNYIFETTNVADELENTVLEIL